MRVLPAANIPQRDAFNFVQRPVAPADRLVRGRVQKGSHTLADSCRRNRCGIALTDDLHRACNKGHQLRKRDQRRERDKPLRSEEQSHDPRSQKNEIPAAICPGVQDTADAPEI